MGRHLARRWPALLPSKLVRLPNHPLLDQLPEPQIIAATAALARLIAKAAAPGKGEATDE